MSPERVSAKVLHQAIVELLAGRGLPLQHAADVAETLVATSANGIDTHGVRLLPAYLRELEGGRAKTQPRFRISASTKGAALFDADDALGVVAANAAMRHAIDRASAAGIAAVAVARSNHFGAAGHYARIAARRNQIGIVFTNSDALVVPFGGRERLNGTNPIAIAAPAMGDDDFCLDFATSEISFSSVLPALRNRATNADLADLVREVALPPMAGYKGQGLAMAVQIFCALLSSMPFDAELRNMYEPPYSEPRRISHFMMAIDIAAFVDVAAFRERLSQLLARFRTAAAAGDTPVRVPGDPERIARAERLRDGIPLLAEEAALLAPYLRRSDSSCAYGGAA